MFGLRRDVILRRLFSFIITVEALLFFILVFVASGWLVPNLILQRTNNLVVTILCLVFISLLPADLDAKLQVVLVRLVHLFLSSEEISKMD